MAIMILTALDSALAASIYVMVCQLSFGSIGQGAIQDFVDHQLDGLTYYTG